MSHWFATLTDDGMLELRSPDGERKRRFRPTEGEDLAEYIALRKIGGIIASSSLDQAEAYGWDRDKHGDPHDFVARAVAIAIGTKRAATTAKGPTICIHGHRCDRCLKLDAKIRMREYQEKRRVMLEESDRDELGNLIVHPSKIQSLLNARMRVGRAFRRWHRRRKNDGPGTPLGRLGAIGDDAERLCGATGFEAEPPESIVVRELERARDAHNPLLGALMAILPYAQVDISRGPAHEGWVQAMRTVGHALNWTVCVYCMGTGEIPHAPGPRLHVNPLTGAPITKPPKPRVVLCMPCRGVGRTQPEEA